MEPVCANSEAMFVSLRASSFGKTGLASVQFDARLFVERSFKFKREIIKALTDDVEI